MRSQLRLSVLLLLTFALLATGIIAQTAPVKVLGNDTLTFEEAGGTGNGQPAYASSVSGLHFNFYESQASIDISPDASADREKAAIHLRLSGANQHPQLAPQGLLPGVVSYFPSSDTRSWRTNLRTWSGLRYQQIYPGIDLVYYGNRGQLEYDFVVEPGRDAKSIALQIGNAQHVSISRDGGLEINSGNGTSLRFSKPVIYQLTANGSREPVAGRYAINAAGRIGFDIPTWDRSRALVIDPVLAWSSYMGQNTDTFYAGAVDSSNNLYLAGRSSGSLIVQKISSDGATILYRAIFTNTPSYSAIPQDIRVDSTGVAYVVGYSGTNFPTTANAFLGSVTSGQHAFVAVINAAGTALTYASYLAGTTNASDQANGVAIDSTKKIYVTGFTNSTTFPTTTGVVQTANLNNGQTAFISKIDPSKSGSASLVYSTYLSGPTTQAAENAIAVDASGNAYVTGNSGGDFPVTSSAFRYDGEGIGQGGVYVTKLNPTATALVYSAYIGVGQANGIAVDSAGNAYLTGTVGVEDFPTTTGAYQVTYPNGFASELNAAGAALTYSTFLSGPQELITPTSIAIEPGCASACAAFVTGYTSENDLTLLNPIQAFNASFINGQTGNDAFVTELNGTGTATVYSTYIGGSFDDSTQSTTHSPSIAVNATGDAFVVGETSSNDFPNTIPANAQRNTYALRISAAAGATNVVFPATLVFSTQQPVGVASTALVTTLRNMGSTAMSITSITPTPSDYTQTNTCGSSVPAGGECTISVIFNPATAASLPGTLVITTSGNNSPTTVTLTGSGVAQPFITLTPPSLTFLDQRVGTASPTQTITVTNTAKTSLTFSNPAFSISANFAQTNNCPATLAQNVSCIVNVAFLPTQNGAFGGQLFASSNTNGLATTFVSLSGNGVVGNPAVTLSSSGLNFNPQVLGTTSPAQSVSVTNTSNVPVTIFGVSLTGMFTDYTATGCVQTLNPGTACNVRITFVPTAAGARTATVVLADSTTVGTHSFTVTGTGLAPTSTLSIDPPSLLFADMAVGATSASLTVQITNTGNAAVLINRVFTTGDFRVNSTSCVTSLRVGSTCNTTLQFVPTAVGARTGKLTIEDNATGNPQSVTLSGKGIAAVPAAIVSPDAYNFGTQAIGTTSISSPFVTLTNIGNFPFDASNVTITGANAGDFQISSQGCLNVVVVPGRTCGVNLAFTPTAAGARAATLTFTNAAGTQTSALVGTGVAATFALGLTPTALTFQPQQKGVASPAQTVWLINNGTAAITVSSLVAGSSDYQVNGCVGSPIQPHTSCQVSVTLTPTINTGADNSTMTITSNAAGSPQTVSLTGSGAAALPTVQLLPAGLAFNSQVVATTSTGQFVEVLNTSASAITGVSVATAGANAADFALTGNNCTGSIAASSACSFGVTFKPAAAGARTATVNVTDSAGTQKLSLAGFAVASSTSALLLNKALSFTSETIGFSSPVQNISFVNTGNSPFTISSVVLGGANASDFSIGVSCPISPNVFNALATCNTSATFTPTAAGTRTATVTITYTGAAGSPVIATLTGKGVAATQALEVGPAAIAFPPQVVTTQSPISPTVLLTNTGTAPVTITSIALGGTNPGDFAIGNGCPLTPSTLQQGPLNNTCGVSVTFTPTLAGARKATLTITDSAPGSPTVINLTGNGLAKTETLVVTPKTLAFDPQVTGTTSQQQFITVSNTGNFPVTFTNVTITNGYALSNGCSGALPPNSACSIGVTYTPSAAGNTAGTVTIADNATGSPQKVTLSGTGIATSADIQLSQTSVVFDAQTVSTLSPSQLVYFYNQGNTTVTINTITQADPEFSLSGSSCVATAQVSPQSSCIFRISFTPSAAGNRTSTLTITDTAPGSPRHISLSGIGITSSVPEVNLSPAALTFASQGEGSTSAPQNINLTNNGTANLTISGITLTGANPGDYAQTNNCVSPLAAGFSCNIAVTFSPTATGTRTASLTVTDNATGSPHSVALTGTGKVGSLPVVTLTPPSLAFPSVLLNTPSAQVVTVKNTGAAALTVSNVTITGTVPSNFAVVNTCSGSIAVNATCTITVTFTPTTIENQTGTVTITDNAGNSPQSVPITGTGAEAAVFISPSSLTFASQKVGTTSAAQTITVLNYGDIPLTMSTPGTTGPFLVSATTCGATLSPGFTCTISIEFKPTATGAASGDLVLNDNAGDSPQRTLLSGTGS